MKKLAKKDIEAQDPIKEFWFDLFGEKGIKVYGRAVGGAFFGFFVGVALRDGFFSAPGNWWLWVGAILGAIMWPLVWYIRFSRDRRVLAATPAGRKFVELAEKYCALEKNSEYWVLDEGNRNQINATLKSLWLEAHSQAGLVLDLAPSTHEMLQLAEEASQYVRVLDESRKELQAELTTEEANVVRLNAGT